MPIQTWFDDSYDDAMLILAGFAGDAQAWAHFSTEWDARLQESPTISYFKLNELVSKKGQWERIKSPQREKKLGLLVEVIRSHGLLGLIAPVERKPFRKGLGSLKGPRYDSDIAFAHKMAIAEICVELYARGVREPFDMIFDEQKKYEREIQALYPQWREDMRVEMKPEGSILPAALRFESDLDFNPLQAGDLLAGIARQILGRHVDREKDPLGKPIWQMVEVLTRPLDFKVLEPWNEKRLTRVHRATEAVVKRIDAMPRKEQEAFLSDRRNIAAMMAEEVVKAST